MRVSQQETLYACERSVDVGRVYTSLEDVRRTVRWILDQEWAHENWPRVRAITVHQRDGRTSESVGAWFEDDLTGQVELLPVHWNDLFICHEVAHVLADSQGSVAHDPIFVRAYCLLVYYVMGPIVWQDLRQRFLDAGIIIDPKDE